MTRVRVLEWLLAGLVTAAVGASFLSWGVSGSVGRSSYQLVDSARALGLLDGAAVRIAPVWFLLSFVAAATVVALATQRRRLAGALGIVLGVALVSAAYVVKSSPVGVDTGAIAGALLGAATVVVGAVLLIPERGARRDRRAHRSDPAGDPGPGRADHTHADTGAAPASAATTTTDAGGHTVRPH